LNVTDEDGMNPLPLIVSVSGELTPAGDEVGDKLVMAGDGWGFGETGGGRPTITDVGIEVMAGPSALSPSTATFPAATVKSAEPRLPAMAAKPRRSLKMTAVLAFAPNGTVEVPIRFPVVSRAAIETTVATGLGLTMATAVTRFVSSKIR
jgi:hypothetical protein